LQCEAILAGKKDKEGAMEYEFKDYKGGLEACPRKHIGN